MKYVTKYITLFYGSQVKKRKGDLENNMTVTIQGQQMKRHALQRTKGIASSYLQYHEKCLSQAIYLLPRQNNYQNSKQPLTLTLFLTQQKHF